MREAHGQEGGSVMTRKHFELIAQALGVAISEERTIYAHDKHSNGEAKESARRDKARMAEGAAHAAWTVMEALQHTNDQFDRDRFWEAVGKAERAHSDAKIDRGIILAPISWGRR
jgi:hypothetical protein